MANRPAYFRFPSRPTGMGFGSMAMTLTAIALPVLDVGQNELLQTGEVPVQL